MLRKDYHIPHLMDKHFKFLSLVFQNKGGAKTEISLSGKQGLIRGIDPSVNNGRFTLIVRPRVTERTLMALVDGKKKILPKADDFTRVENRELIPSEDMRNKYTFNFSIIEGTTMYPQNHFRMFRVNDDGIFSSVEVGIITQATVFFLVIQEKYEGLVQRRGNCFYVYGYPGLDSKEWPQLQEIIKALTLGLELPEFSVHSEIEKLPSLASKEARVIWFDLIRNSGTGIAETSEEPVAALHWKNSRAAEGALRVFFPGEIISYEKLRERRSVGGVKLEAIGVSLGKFN